MSERWFCGKCGAANHLDDGFCEACGTKRRGLAQAEATDAPSAETSLATTDGSSSGVTQAQKDYYEARTVQIADDLVRRARRDEAVHAVVTGAKTAAVGIGKLFMALAAFAVGGIILVIVLVNSQSTAPSVSPSSADPRATFAEGCRTGRYTTEVLTVNPAGVTVVAPRAIADDFRAMGVSAADQLTCEAVMGKAQADAAAVVGSGNPDAASSNRRRDAGAR